MEAPNVRCRGHEHAGVEGSRVQIHASAQDLEEGSRTRMPVSPGSQDKRRDTWLSTPFSLALICLMHPDSNTPKSLQGIGVAEKAPAHAPKKGLVPTAPRQLQPCPAPGAS